MTVADQIAEFISNSDYPSNLPARTVAEIVNGTGLNPVVVRNTVTRMVGAGRLIAAPKLREQDNGRVATAFRVAESGEIGSLEDRLRLERYDKEIEASKVERNCLTCRMPFSTTEHYRLCDECRRMANEYHFIDLAPMLCESVS